jgi:type IV pilus assembly protein PilA
MLKNLQKRNQGFTIVEVMIVLAIAGLIILVVLLAVPALQRNSRNTSLKSDASSVAGAINEFESVNNGRSPTAVTVANGVVTVAGAATDTSVTGKVQGGTTVNSNATGTAASATSTVTVALGRKCNDTVVGAANTRANAVTYVLETSSATAAQCLEA